MKNEEMKNKAVSPEELSEDALNDISGGIRISCHNVGLYFTEDPVTNKKMQSLSKYYYVNQDYNGVHSIEIEEHITEVLSENAANA